MQGAGTSLHKLGESPARSSAPPREQQASPSIASWTQSLKEEGLCTDPDAQTLSMPSAECGVSLEYLHKLSQRVGDLLGTEADTATVVQKLVLPATTRARRGRYGRTHAWGALSQSTCLCTCCSRPEVPALWLVMHPAAVPAQQCNTFLCTPMYFLQVL